MSNETFNLLFLLLVIIVVIVIFVLIANRLRKYGGSLTTKLFGSVYDFLNRDKRKAAKEITEMKTSKKTEEEKTFAPDEN